MIFSYLSQHEIVAYVHFRWNVIQFILLRKSSDFVPVLFVIPVKWSITKFPRSLYSSFFLHAICVSTIVDLHLFEVRLVAMFLQSRDTFLLRKIEIVLEMYGTFGTFL